MPGMVTGQLFGPISDVVGFSERDGLTHLEIQRRLRKAILELTANVDNQNNVIRVGVQQAADAATASAEAAQQTIENADTAVSEALSLEGGASRSTLDSVSADLIGNLTSAIRLAMRSILPAINVKDYGAIGDGITDDTAAINAAIAAAPGDSSVGGSTILFPYGTYRVTSQINISKAGIRLQGTGGFTSIIKPDPTLTGVVFLFAAPSSYMRGPRITDLRFDMNAANAGAVRLEGAYDNVILENVFITGLVGSNSGIKMIPAAGAPSDISQTMSVINCYVIGITGYVGKAWHLENVQEAVFISCKGYGGGEGVGTAWYLKRCRGVAFYGCSAAICSRGWDLDASSGSMVGITIDAPTVEGATATIMTTGTSTNTIQYLSVRAIRRQIATSIAAGPINLDYVVSSVIESSNVVVTITNNCSLVRIITEDATKVTDNGQHTSILAWENFSSRARFGSTTGASLFLGTEEHLRIANPGTAETGLLITANPTGAGAVLTRVTVGAADSGGTGYRVLRVANTPS